MTTNLRTKAVAALAGLIAFVALGASSASAAEVTAKADPESVTFGRGSVAIEGALTADAGVSPAGRVLKLYERPFPYKRSKQIAEATTNADGSYAFEGVKPDVNSTYKVAINDPDLAARSKAALVVVFARGDLKVKATRDREIVSRFRLVYSPKLNTKLAGREVRWYFNEVGKPRFTIADKTRSKQTRKGLLKSKSRFPAPPGDYRFRVTYCLDVPNEKDIGIGTPGAPRNCPNSFPAAASRALLAVAAAAPLSTGP